MGVALLGSRYPPAHFPEKPTGRAAAPKTIGSASRVVAVQAGHHGGHRRVVCHRGLKLADPRQNPRLAEPRQVSAAHTCEPRLGQEPHLRHLVVDVEPRVGERLCGRRVQRPCRARARFLSGANGPCAHRRKGRQLQQPAAAAVGLVADGTPALRARPEPYGTLARTRQRAAEQLGLGSSAAHTFEPRPAQAPRARRTPSCASPRSFTTTCRPWWSSYR